MGRIREPLKVSNFRHGHKTESYESPTYTSWRGMRDRCRRHPNYAEVSVDPRWDSFQNFLDDMGERPEGHDIDRWPNEDGDYTPSNCQWTPASVNRSRGGRRNKRGKNK